MFGLSEAHYNIVKQAAKRCVKEIKEQIDGGKKYDHVAAPLISKHHEGVSVLVSRLKFVYICGYINGRWGKGQDYE